MSVSESNVSSESTSAPERSRAETRRRLLAAGTECFARGGLHGVTSAQIARAAGVATGTFYLHFPDKKALFREIVFEALDTLRARQDRAASQVPADPASPLPAMRARLAELLAVAEENRSLFRVLFGRDHEGAELGEDVLDDLVPGIEERLRERAALGEAPAGLHPAVAAQAIAGMTARVVAWWVEDPSRAPRAEVIDTLLSMHPVGRGRDT